MISMCGIMAAISQEDVSQILTDGLKHLEYRGYDSAGIAVINEEGHLQCQRTVGKVQDLQSLLTQKPRQGHIGIAHTRWATHGKPSLENTHPHLSGNNKIAVVHNGIIENHLSLRASLLTRYYVFYSETDTEVIAHLLQEKLTLHKDLLGASRAIMQELLGTFSIVILYENEPDRLIAIKRGNPLIIGLGQNGHFVSSDPAALLSLTRQFIYLEEGDIAEIRKNRIAIYDQNGNEQSRTPHTSTLTLRHVQKKGFQHYMQKEIFEQADIVQSTFSGCFTQERIKESSFGDQASSLFSQISQVYIAACGSSYHAGLVAQHYLEVLSGLACSVKVASEIRYHPIHHNSSALFVALSQSGETADTLNALRSAKASGRYLTHLAICNTPESSLVREADLVFLTRAGLEMSVASTKTFLAQLCALLLLSLALGHYHKVNPSFEAHLVSQLKTLPQNIQITFRLDSHIQQIAHKLAHQDHILLIARDIHYPIALEAALKLKEVAYIHAEAFPAGELKHGSLALVDNKTPVIALFPDDSLIEKMQSNIQEIKARGGHLIIFADNKLKIEPEDNLEIIRVPSISPLLSPIIYTIPLQLLAYHLARLKGNNIDRPRNLAKSVTVE